MGNNAPIPIQGHFQVQRLSGPKAGWCWHESLGSNLSPSPVLSSLQAFILLPTSHACKVAYHDSTGPLLGEICLAYSISFWTKTEACLILQNTDAFTDGFTWVMPAYSSIATSAHTRSRYMIPGPSMPSTRIIYSCMPNLMLGRVSADVLNLCKPHSAKHVTT